MVTTQLSEYSNEEIIFLIEGVSGGEVPYTLDGLKKLLAEVTNRNLGQEYMNNLTALIEQALSSKDYVPSPTADSKKIERSDRIERSAKDKADKIQKKHEDKLEQELNKQMRYEKLAEEINIYDSYDKFPILSFLIGLYKVVAWFVLAGFIAGTSVVAYVFMNTQVIFACVTIFCGVVVGVCLLIALYAKSEKIVLQLEIERHLKNLARD